MILDHPEPQNAQVEVWVNGQVTEMGHFYEADSIRRVVDARRVRTTSIQQGLFVMDRATTFEFLYYFDSFDEWTDHLEQKSWSDSRRDQALIQRVGAILSQTAGKIVVCEAVHAARLRRLVHRGVNTTAVDLITHIG